MGVTRILIGISVCFIVLSCKKKLIEPPGNLIPEAQMTNILYDLALIHGLKATSASALDKFEIKTMPYLYDKYGIDSIQFVKSDEYYASVPAIYQNMYTTVQNRLQNRIDEIDKVRLQKTDSARAKNQRIRDSLKKKASSTKLPDSTPSNK